MTKKIVMRHICNYCGHLTGIEGYSQEELNEAVQAEREACAIECENMLFEKWSDSDRQILCAGAIRARRENAREK